ncbi:Nuclear receptor corepressor 1 [Vitis vinifera]|uniref:Nuclear receptor corepressor 1 n=1 Tax=Vitis vinifera TaxID=29760 RepID=A0A438CPS8_VITVI|nr:Nuclear receptor corepressor 1 [Vitis vinifera]
MDILISSGNLSPVPTAEMINYTSKMLSESQMKLCRNILKMPALILDKKEKTASRFISSNGLVEDPCAVENERTMINPWTAEEKEIFMDKLAIFGKEFKKIASFLDHKTTADCVEFYYKNHKSDCFEKTKKKLELRKQGKSLSATTYLVTSGKKWNREMNAASLDMLGAASVMAARAGDSMENLQTCPGKFLLGAHHDYRTPHGDNGVVERSSSYDIIRNERETVAADVLAGICGSLSSEAMSSCITSSLDPGEGYRELRQKVGSGVKRPLTPEVTQSIDEETCSDESCGEMDPADWTDEEKCIFVQAVSSYGKDFAKISRCVRTRSRDQCKVFFSKARKCLGLDLIHPGPNVGTPESDDANGGGSDTEDACVVEAGSVICSNKSGSKMEEDSLLSVLNINPDESDFSGMKNLQTDLNSWKKTEQVFGDSNSLNGIDSKSLTLHVEKNGPCTKMEMDHESVSAVEATDPSDRSNAVSQAEDFTEGNLLPETSLNVRREENSDADTSGQMSLKCTVKDSEVKENALHQVANSTSCPRFIFNSGCQDQVSVELDNQKPGVISLLQESSLMAEDSVPKDSSVIQYEKTLDQGMSPSTLDLKETKDKKKSIGVDEYHQHLSGHSLLNNAVNAELSQKVGGCPLQTPPKEDMNRDLSCKNPSTAAERLSKLDRDIQSSHSLAQDCYLQKCNGSKSHSLGTELPFLSQSLERTSNQTRAHGRSLSDTEKTSRNGDFKLFGQILSHPSSLQNPNSCSNENDDKGAHNPKLSSKSDTNRFSSLPDSTLLLAKYPAAFSNYPMSSSTKIEQQSLQTVVKSNERNLNGISVFPTRDMSSSNGVADYHQVFRGRDCTKLQPFTVDMKQRQDLFSEMQRRNGFEAVSSLQAPGRGMVGMNVVGRGGILVGGACTPSVSDPVAAIKMHYAKTTDQFGGQGGSIIRDDESWRGNGDIGR